MTTPTVVIGFLGTQLDSGRGAGRWEKWRPSVSLTQQPDMVVSRFELLYTAPHAALAYALQADIRAVSPETEVRPTLIAIDDPWDFGEVYAALYDWARAYPFAPERERYWAHITTGTHVAQICMFLLVEAGFIPGVLLQTAPPKRQKDGEPGTYALIDLDLSRYDKIAQRFDQEQREAVAFLKRGIATRNPAFNALIDEIERVAIRSSAPLLLAGPTGAGKSFLARRMYELKRSRRQVDGAFVEVNCATLRGDGAASTLFGHKKGAFTGAASDRAGLLKSAHRGLLFLDEIGELGLDEQAMLLKAIEEKRFYPVGADQEVDSEFQLIAGTNRDLRAEVAAGRFRDDLFARINLWTYALPGLAQRPEDIEPNIEHLLSQLAVQNSRAVRFSAEAKARYLRFAQSKAAPWRGNFRDLSASVTRLATLAEGGRITEELVEAEIQRLRWMWARPGDEVVVPSASASTSAALVDSAISVSAGSLEAAEPGSAAHLIALVGRQVYDQMDVFDRLQLQSVLKVCERSDTLSDAGRALFQVSRLQRSVPNDADRLRKYLLRFGLVWDRGVRAG